MISVIIPFHNAVDTLERCIKSVLLQTFRDIEILLVDNNSNDGSRIICESISAKNPNVRYIFNKDLGVSLSRNIGLKNATGNYIMFIDADDYIEKSHCEQYFKKLLEENSELVIGGYRVENNNETVSIAQMAEKNFKSDQKYDLVKLLIEKSTLNACWNKLYIKDKIIDFFEEDNSLGEDVLFNLSYMARIDSISTLFSTTYIYDVTRDNSLSRKIRFDLLESSIKILMKEMYFFNIEPSDPEAKIFNDFFVTALYSQIQAMILYKKEFISIHKLKIFLKEHGYSLDAILDNNTLKKNKKIQIFVILYKKNMKKMLTMFFKTIDLLKKIK